MRKKQIPNIYIRQDHASNRKTSLVRKPFIIALAVIIALVVGILAYIYRDMWMKKPQQPVTVIQKETITLYVPADQNKLIEKKIDITNNLSDKEKGNLIIKNLKALKSVPEELILKDLVVDYDGILYLNFSQIISEKPMSTITEILKTFSIVNSFLGSFKNANKIQFLVEGQPVYTLNGTIYTYKPLEFNKDLLED